MPPVALEELFFCFRGMVHRQKTFSLNTRSEPLSEILPIVNLRHAMSRILTCTEPEFRLC